MRKSRWVAGLLTLALILTMIPGTVLGVTAAQVPLTDVRGTAYEKPVAALYDIGVVGGTSPTTYSPGDKVTRAQMAAFLIRALKWTDHTKKGFTPKFNDVKTTDWFFGEVMLAEQMGIVRGMSTTEFWPSSPVTYPQAVVMTLRALGYENGTLSYPQGYVLLAKDMGLLEDLKWDLNGEMVRGEVAVLLANAVFKAKHKEYDMTLSQKLFKKAYTVQIAPTAEQLPLGTTQLTASGKDAYDRSLPGLDAQWRVVSGSASLTAGGSLTTQGGDVTVEAAIGELKSTRTYKVLSNIAITPATASAKPGDTVSLKVVSGTQEVTGAVWAVESGAATVTQDGKVTVAGAGNVVVTAKLGALTARATITAATGLMVDPANPIVAVGGTVNFTVKRSDGTAFTGPVRWSVEGSGSIAADGKFTAAAGTAPTIKVTAGDLVATTGVQVVGRLEVQPGPSVAIQKSKTQIFTAKAITIDGKQIDVPVTWTSTGKIGIMGAGGEFVATTPGTGTAVASYGPIKQAVNVSVSGEATSIVVSASRNSVPANGRSTITVKATLKDVNGTTVAIDSPVQFLLSDSTKGTLSVLNLRTVNGEATTIFTPSSGIGNFRITAAATDLPLTPGFADLSTYAPVPAKIRLSANPNPIASAVNSRASVTATLLDNEGYEIVNTIGTAQVVSLYFASTTGAMLSNTNISIMPGTSKGEVIFTAGNPGDVVINGTAAFPVEPVVVQTRVSGAAAKVAIRPGVVETKADGVSEMVVYAEIQDANGVVRTQDHGVAITLTATNSEGVNSPPAVTVTTVSGVATYRIKHTKAGTFNFTATSASLSTGTGSGKFVAGTAIGLKLSVVPTAVIAADATSTVKLRAEIVDANDNPVPTASGTVTFQRITSQNATSMPATVAVPTVGGVADLTLTSTVYPGTDSFRASVQGMNLSNLVEITSRITGVPNKLSASVSAGAVAVGSTVQVRVLVQDSQGYTVTGANNRMIRVTPNSPTAVVTGTGITESGVATFTVTDTTAGVVRLTVSSDGLTSDASQAIQYTAGSPARVALKVSSDEMSADNGLSYIQLYGEVQDAYGNPVTQAIPVSLTLSRNDVVTLSSTYLYTGNYVYIRANMQPGSVTISGTAGVPVTPVSLSTFIPGAPTKVRVESIPSAKAGTSTTFRVKLLDNFGHVLTGMSTGTTLSAAGVMLSGSSGNTTTISNQNLYGLINFSGNGTTHGSAPFANGIATFTYYNSKAETVTITPVVYYGNAQLPVETGTISTTAGNPTQLRVTSTRTGLSSQSVESTVVEATLQDAAGNPVAVDALDTFNVTLSTNAYLDVNGPLSISTNNGKAVLQVASKVHAVGGATTITVTSAKSGMTGSLTIMTDRPPTAPIVFATDALGLDTTLSAGETASRLVITVEARNSAQTITVYVNGFQVNLYGSAAGGSAVNTIQPNQTTMVGYLLRSELGGNGPKSIRVVIQNSVAPGPMSNAQTINLE